ncbi:MULTISPECIES: TfoX/Sxy family protein [Sphingomonas]|uniref:DNA transformation protein n=1 Tax=Sphingomonas leidyi TaxID=68569 RepID=A0A7X5V439_9SPHN|nr:MULTISPECIES: TfoX/Sxy family protein [Sphingomonas]MBN8813521.1 TfoX/Sxy family protein [Sphingomonas sp.]NIJ66917.1 DNA transformation protein [Sphingomonas leidyi]OJY52422.1 MAG: competence protein TfoX [Sphingomonas sp. 67-41]
MAVDQGLVEWVKEAMEPVGTVTSKRLFGGAALYLDGLAFAILAFDALWLKADAESALEWGDAERFSVTREDGRVQSLNYRRAPDETYDDADALRRWALLAMEAARRAPPKKPRARKRA